MSVKLSETNPMVRSNNDGGPAFPVMVNHIDQAGSSEVMLEHEGMSLRDYFAAKAMKGILCSMNRMMQFDGPGLARDSYAIADLMLAERNKP